MIKEFISQWLRSGSAEAPLLLTGTLDAPWQTTIERIVLEAMCLSPTKKPCENCRACKQVLHAVHPDFITVEGDERIIRVAHIEALRTQLHITPLSTRRIIYIPRVHRLHDAAANMLLKEFEESSTWNRFLLTTPYPSALLPTILSRSSLLRIPPEPATRLKEIAMPSFTLEKLTALTRELKRDTLSEEHLTAVTNVLQEYIRSGATSAATFRCLLRLRDYYKICALRGNEKMAADVLLASLTQLRNTMNK